jgi:Ni,Fe-hydrogenase III small subunit
MRQLLGKIVRTGRVTERAAGQAQPDEPDADAALPAAASGLHGSLQVRQVDAGSCNGCEAEFAAAFGPVYDVERFGVRLVASPRHADALVVTGPVTRNMAVPLVKTLEATPGPKLVIALGDCARDCGVFAGGYGIAGSVADIVPVDIEIPGCPPSPDVIIAALRRIAGR